MAKKPSPDQSQRKGSDREVRLKAALKANMARRKAQARARSVEAGGGTPSKTPPQMDEESR